MRIFARIAGALFLIAAAIHPAYAGSAYTGNSYYLGGSTWASPQAIGSATPNTGAFTNLSASGTVSGAGFSSFLTSSTLTSTLAAPPAIGINTPNAVYASPLYFDTLRNMSGAHILMSNGAISIASGFGTSPAIYAVNTTAAIEITIGSGGTASSGVINLPTATNGWVCFAQDITTLNDAIIHAVSTNSTVTLSNQNASTGAALAWTAADKVVVSCHGL